MAGGPELTLHPTLPLALTLPLAPPHALPYAKDDGLLEIALGRPVADDQSGIIEVDEVRARLNLRAPLRNALRHYRVAAYCATIHKNGMGVQWELTSDSADSA